MFLSMISQHNISRVRTNYFLKVPWKRLLPAIKSPVLPFGYTLFSFFGGVFVLLSSQGLKQTCFYILLLCLLVYCIFEFELLFDNILHHVCVTEYVSYICSKYI